jgi:hypothetical protein
MFFTYVACSKLGFAEGLHTQAPTGKTTNLVYKEVLRWIFIVRMYICIVKNN